MSPTVIALDVETHPFEPYNQAPRIVCLSLATGQRSDLLVREQIESWLHAVLSSDYFLVGHHIAYDMACILANFPDIWELVWKAYDDNRVHCTAIRERLLDIATGEFRRGGDKTGYSLEDIAERRLMIKLNKDDNIRLKYKELDGVPLDQWPQASIDYAIEDATTTLKLLQHQEKRAIQMGYKIPTQFDDTRADLALKLMSAWGITTDQERVDQLWKTTVSRMYDLCQTLLDKELVRGQLAEQSNLLSDERELPNITKNLKNIRAAVIKHHPGPGKPPLTEKGAIQTGKEVLAECNWEPFDTLIEYSTLQKNANTYLDKLFQSIIHARFDAVGAPSDRTACSGPNLQNQPRLPGVRECFVARPGKVFLASDFDSQEMRTLAQSCLDICGRSRLAEKYQADRHFDPHLEFARQLGNEALRQEAKICNFGFPGGLGYKSFVQYAKNWGVNIDEARAKELKDLWFQTWPEMTDYFKHASSLVGDARYGTQTIPQSGFIRMGVDYKQASNGYFQTLAAHASKSALWEVSKRAYNAPESPLYGSRPVLFVHDEIVVEVSEEGAHEAAVEMEAVLVECMEKWTPDIPSAASATLMWRWSKEAKRVMKDGRLVPWEKRK